VNAPPARGSRGCCDLRAPGVWRDPRLRRGDRRHLNGERGEGEHAHASTAATATASFTAKHRGLDAEHGQGDLRGLAARGEGEHVEHRGAGTRAPDLDGEHGEGERVRASTAATATASFTATRAHPGLDAHAARFLVGADCQWGSLRCVN
jgi:hypothetical protein